MASFRFTQGPKILVDFGNMILDELESITLRPSATIQVTRSPGGTLADVIAGAAAAATTFPFKITWRVNPSNPSLFQAMVEADSTVMLSGQPNNNLAVTGLGTWFDFLSTDVIALYIVVASYVAISATIQSYGQGNTTFDPTLAAWNAGDNSYVFDDGGTPPSQIGINILLGYSTPDANGNPFLVQSQFTHVLLENCSIDGEPAIFDWSHRERYGITAP